MKRIAVTGGTGSKGRGFGAVVMERLEKAGYEPVNLDIAKPTDRLAEFRHVDLTNYGDTFAAMHGCDAVVHLAANADPDWNHVQGAQRFHVNMLSTYNVFQAAMTLGMERVVWASSETVLGFPNDIDPPKLLPTDDNLRKPQCSYGLSKAAGEYIAEEMSRWSGMPIIGLRFSNIHYEQDGHPEDYKLVPSYWDNPRSRMLNIFGYVDNRDVAQAIEKSLTADIKGAEVFTIAAADTCMRQTNEELVAEFFPGCELKPGTGPHDTLIGIDKARDMLGYEPEYSWRSILGYE